MISDSGVLNLTEAVVEGGSESLTNLSARNLDCHVLRPQPQAIRLRRRSQSVEMTAGVCACATARPPLPKRLKRIVPRFNLEPYYSVAIEICEEAAPGSFSCLAHRTNAHQNGWGSVGATSDTHEQLIENYNIVRCE